MVLFKKIAVSLAVILVTAGAIYANSLKNSFHLDDAPSVYNNTAIRDAGDIPRIWRSWPTRFVTYYSFALNYHVNGQDVVGYHIVNVLLHAAAAMGVWWLVFLITQSTAMALFTALIFLTHPIQTQPVNYITQRAVLLAGLFYIGAMAFYVKSRLSSSGVVYYAAAFVCALLGIFSKEMTVTLPLALVLLEYFFLRKDKSLAWRRLLPFFACMMVLPLLTIQSFNLFAMPKAAQDYSGVSVGQYFLTQLNVIATYLRLLILPIKQSIAYDYPLAQSWLSSNVLLSAGLHISILAAAVKLRQSYKLISFGIFFFYLTLLPESSVIPIRDLIFEHRLYLPSLGFSVFLVSFVFYGMAGKNRSLAMRVLMVIVLTYAALTINRNKVWANEFTLWDNALKNYPRCAMAYFNRGVYYHSQGQLDKAMADYNMVIGLGPVDAVLLSNRGDIFRAWGQYDLAMANFNLAEEVNPSYTGTYANRGLLYQLMGKKDEARADLIKAGLIKPQ